MPAAGGGSWDGGGSGGTHTRHLEPRNELPPFPGHDSYALLFLFVKFVLRRKMISLSHMTCFETQCNSLQGLRKAVPGSRQLRVVVLVRKVCTQTKDDFTFPHDMFRDTV